jgi:hypothetical protein
MGAMSSNDLPPDATTASKGGGMIVVGYSTAAAGLVAFLTTNGASSTPVVATIGTAALIAIGFLLPVAGILQLRSSLGRVRRAARSGFTLQAFGLVGLLFGVVLVQVAPTLSGYIVAAVFVVVAGGSAVAGAVLVQRDYNKDFTSNARDPAYPILGIAMIFSGVGVIMGSNIAFEYLISSVENTIYVDVGATVSACGFVLAAYSSFDLFRRHW